MARGVVFSDAILDEIKSRTNFADLASEHIKLKKAGKTFSGLCPFHSEKTPSFHLNDEEGFFNCFGCGKKGSLYNFVMETRGLTFPEAVKFLAGRAGVELPTEEDEGGRNLARERSALLREILRAASTAYQKEFDRSKPVNAYVSSRGLTPKTIERFGLGYAPRGWEFIYEAVKRELLAAGKNLDESEIRSLLLEVGLIRRRNEPNESAEIPVKDGATTDNQILDGILELNEEPNQESAAEKRPRERGAYDLLRDRLIFPIMRSDGIVVAFGGRLMSADNKAPKYLNTPESPLYFKRRTLFGLSQAMDALRRTKQGFLVEGYMDVLTMVQAGFEGSVACCGTAITVEHAQVLARVAERVIVLFDGDAAGQKAAAKSVEAFLNSGVDLLVAVLPEGEDPDSLIKKGGAGGLQKFIDGAVPGIDFLVSAAIKEESAGGSLAPSGSGRVAGELCRVVARVKNPVEREFCLKVVAEKLGVSIDSFDKMVREEVRREGRSSFGGTIGASNHSRFQAQGVAAVQRESRPGGNESTETDVTDVFDPWAGVPPIDYFASVSQPESGWNGPDMVDNFNKAKKRDGAKQIKGTRFSDRPLVDEEKLITQLLVTVLCEPSVAEEVIQLSSLFQGPDSQYGDIPPQLLEFLNVAKREELPPSELFLEQGSRADLERERVISLLNSMNFHGKRIVGEVIRQLSVGGIKPDQLVKDLAKASRSQDIRLEVRSLNAQIQGENVDDVDKLKLAQDKLLKRRSLEQLR